MATAYTIPAATSVVDFLNSSKQDSSFSARSKLYSSAGIDKRLGAFTGTSSQNSALLDHLKAQSAPPASTPASSLVTTAKTTTPQTAAIAPFNASTLPRAVFNPTPTPAPIDFTKINITPAAAPPITNVFQPPAQASVPPDFSKLNLAPPAAPAAPATSALSTIAPSAPAPSTPGSGPTTPTTPTTTVSSTTLYPNASQYEGDLVNNFLNSAEGAALLDKQQRGEIDDTAANAEAKRLLEVKYASDRTTLENSLAKNGLAFSGIRNTQLGALVDNLAASELNVDRQLASKLLESNATLRDGILKGVKDLITQAAAKDKEAIAQLNAVGLAVVNGQVVPTLAARNADRAAAQQEVANARAQANFQLQEQRLQLSQEAADRAEARFKQLYGAGKSDGFAYAQQLFDLNPTATPAELRAALFENTNLSSTEVDAAMNLVGIPKALQPNIVQGYVASAFKGPTLSRLLPGDQSQKALDAAKKQAAKDLAASGGVIQINTGTTDKPKYVTYNVTSDQLNALIQMTNTVTLDEVKSLQ